MLAEFLELLVVLVAIHVCRAAPGTAHKRYGSGAPPRLPCKKATRSLP